MLFLFLACADSTPTWAVQHASVVPTPTGLTGVQLWEFFSAAWTPEGGDEGYLCTRAQLTSGAVTTLEGCAGCRAAYTITVTELDSDCDNELATDPAFSGPAAYAISDVPDELVATDPHPGDSFGWQVQYKAGELEPLGWAYPESLDITGESGASGWTSDRPYTLWPGVAWAL